MGNRIFVGMEGKEKASAMMVSSIDRKIT